MYFDVYVLVHEDVFHPVDVWLSASAADREQLHVEQGECLLRASSYPPELLQTAAGSLRLLPADGAGILHDGTPTVSRGQ